MIIQLTLFLLFATINGQQTPRPCPKFAQCGKDGRVYDIAEIPEEQAGDDEEAEVDLSRCGRHNGDTMARIVGGTDASPNEYPWLVRLEIKRHTKDGKKIDTQLCEAAIVNEKWLLTAAHCLNATFVNFTVIAGDQDMAKKEAMEQRAIIKYRKEVHIHPGYIDGKVSHDIALIRIKDNQKFNYSKAVGPICLFSDDPGHKTVNISQCVALGWGKTGRNESVFDPARLLQHLRYRVLKNDTCLDVIADMQAFDPETSFCARSDSPMTKTTCSGDSGSPLACLDKSGHFHAVGVDAHGWCTFMNCPSLTVYTRVARFESWIKDTMKIVDKRKKRKMT